MCFSVGIIPYLQTAVNAQYYKNYESGIEDHRLASRSLVMTNGIFLSHPHEKTGKRLPENPEFAAMPHGDVILTLQ